MNMYQTDARESWTASHGWHVCAGTIAPCLGACARRGVFMWTINGHCPNCDGAPVAPCCDGDAA